MMTNAPTDSESATTTPTAPAIPPTAAGDWLIGESYDTTADMSMAQLAEKVETNLYNVRADELFPAIADFAVSVDSGAPVPVLRIGITGLVDDTLTATSEVYDWMRVAFGLANHYNRVNLAHPSQARFIQHITALGPHGEPGLVLIGMMHNVGIA
jgi:hypothetical protein